MRHLSRWFGSLSVAAVIVATASSAGPAALAQSPGASAGAASPLPQVCAGKKVAFATTQKTGDQGVVDDMVSNGLDAAKDRLGATTTLVEALDPAAYEQVLTTLANAGNNVIATTFNEMTEPLKAVAAKFPDVHFVQIYGDPVDPTIPNLRTVAFRYDEATYLAGLVAGAVTDGTLGYEAGLLIPGINTDVNAFKLAAMSVNPNVKVIVGEVGSFSDDAKAKQVSNALYAQGADIIQNDGPIVGLMQAAKEKNKYAILGAAALVDQAPANSMGVAFINFGESLFQQIQAACQDDFTGGHVQTGVKDGTTGFYVPDQFLAAGDPAVVAKVQAAIPAMEQARADIISGALEVPFNPAKP